MHNNACSLSFSFSLGENKQEWSVSFSISLEREISKHRHCPSPSVLRGNQASSSPRSGGCPPHRNTRLFGWLVGGQKGSFFCRCSYRYLPPYCAHLLDCCMDLLLLLLHCFSCIASISYCYQNTKLFSHNLFSSSLFPTQNLRQYNDCQASSTLFKP